MRTVVKYRLAHVNRQNLEMPKDTAFLGLAFENQELHFWADVDLNDETLTRRFFILEEGDSVPGDSLVLVGDVQPPAGNRWFIFFEFGDENKS